MTRRWRIRAAERPARRRANPPSPTKYRSPVRVVGILVWWKAINLIINAKLTRILFTTEIIAQMFDVVKRVNKILVKKFDTNKYVGYDEKNNWGGACV